ncbi:MAG: hypothetical protein ACFCD0_25130 [Gemmataceae bacterium]
MTMTIRCLTISIAVMFAAMSVPNGTRADGQATWEDRKTFLPYRQYEMVPGRAIGVLVGKAQPVLETEGRSSAPEVMCFSQDGLSYRWVYVPSSKLQPQITNLRVPIGKKPQANRRFYPALEMANLSTLKNHGITKPYVLVEVEVNDGKGSPAVDSFVGTNYRILENTEKFPLVVSEIVARLQKNYAAYVKKRKPEIDLEMIKAQKKALQNRKPNGGPKVTELMYVTWMNKTNELHVRFRTKILDGAYSYVEGPRPIRAPLPLPTPKELPPEPLGAVPKKASAPRKPQKQGVPQRQVRPGKPGGAFPPPPPLRMKVGTSFWIEFGRSYVITRTGKIKSTTILPFESHQSSIRFRAIDSPRRPVDPVPPVLAPKVRNQGG